MRLRSTALCLLASITVASSISIAQDLSVPDSPAAANRPARGMSMQNVETRYGEPSKREAAVGQPPITRWEYPGFVVYFEHDKVIHAVAVG